MQQALGVRRRGALLVVVEINEHGAPLALPSRDVARPGAQGGLGIIVAVLAGRPMAAHIDVPGRHQPGRRRVVVIRQAQRDILRALSQDFDAPGHSVADWMTANPVTIPPALSVEEALDLMLSKRFRHLPVADGGTVTSRILQRWMPFK